MLLEGHDVGHDLAWMRAPRQPVDHRHGGMLRELEQHVVLEGADHDGVDIPRQHAGGVGDGLAAAELHLLAGQHDGVAAELAHRDVERDPRAGRRLVEDHRQHFSGDRRARSDCRRADAARLHGAAVLDDAAQLAGGDVDEVEEVARLGAHGVAPPAAALSRWLRSIRAAAPSMRWIASAISGSSMISGGSMRTTLSPAAAASSFSARSASTSSPFGHDGDEAEQQAFAAHLGDDAGVAVLDLGEALAKQDRAAVDLVEKRRREHQVEHRIADRHGQRIGAEGRAMGAGGHALAGLRGGEAGADRKPAAQRLGDAHHVGRHAAALIGEEAAGAADAGLHLVEHQEQLVLVAQFAQAPQERRRHHPHAALALDRLDQDRRGFRADGAL